ncbi:MAG TPA: outer membrane protein assembly factor BamD [Candidatus Dormibacteraeota bacterium]|nr:outer membrane protein assembly factor BamD [Candidatus Dormibacteraeota bacterium]
MMKKRYCLIALLIAAMAGSVVAPAYAKDKIKVIKEKHKKHKQTQSQNIEVAAEPDKILYERALDSLKHSKYTEERLELQTLINTYPDSEYLAKAKLAIADSFYKEGGVVYLTQAIDAYKSFIVFFPFLDEAQYAQMQVALCHYHMMLKSDRDPTEAESAENELQEFILKYPQSRLLPEAEQNLRNVQEVIADGEYKIGRFYYMKPDYPAAAARLMDVAEHYPLYSGSDDALWMLGNIYMIDRKYTKNEDVKNKWADYAAKCYSRILRDYPLSSHAADAKAQLKAMGMPVPSADPHALARMQRDQLFEKKHHEFALLKWPKEMLESRPDVSDAARVGQPDLAPPDDAISATDVLNPKEAPAPTFTLAAAPVAASSADNSAGDAVPINAEPQSEVDDTPTTTAGAQIISTGADPSDSTSTNSTPAAPAAPDTNPAPGTATPSVLAPVGTDTGTNAVGNSATSGASTSKGDATTSDETPAPTSAPPQTQPNTGTAANAKPAAQPKASKSDPKTESTSKKKHGLHKIVPW